MTRQTDIVSDLDKSKNNANSTMLTIAIFDNTNQNNKKKFVFDCAKDEIAEILNKATGNGKTWVPNNE